MPESVRSVVLSHCLHDHRAKMSVLGVVVMPDHVHMILCLLKDPFGDAYGLAEIMQGIKGASARRVNMALGCTGPLWQSEFFDHVLRDYESLTERVEYICRNPVRQGLIGHSDDYPWLWRAWVEGGEDLL